MSGVRRNSKNDPYMKGLRETFGDRTPIPTTSREEIEMQIASISTSLRGPLSSVERLDLAEARQNLRLQLASCPPPEPRGP